MTNSQRNPEEELRNLMTALAESVFEADDDEILDGSIDKEKTRAALLAGVRAIKQEQMADAREEYKRAISSFEGKGTKKVEGTKQEKLGLLTCVLASRPQFREALTAQFRDFQDLSDADIDSYLKQLSELGAIDEYLDGEEE